MDSRDELAVGVLDLEREFNGLIWALKEQRVRLTTEEKRLFDGVNDFLCQM